MTPRAPSTTTSGRHLWSFWAVLGPGILSAGLGGALYPPLDDYPRILLWGVALGVVLGLLFLPVARFITRSSAKSAFLRLAIGGGLGFVFFGVGGLLVANGLLDPHPLRAHPTEVVSVRDHRENKDVRVRDWRPGREQKTIGLRASGLVNKVGPGDPIFVRASPGLVDWWHRGLQLEATP